MDNETILYLAQGSKRLTPTERAEYAFRAVKRFQRMLPMLSGYARALTGNSKMRVEMTHGTPRTDGSTIYLRPMLVLGDETPHDTHKCDLRDEDDLLICTACMIRELMLFQTYHEMAHEIEGSTERFGIVKRRHALEKAAKTLGKDDKWVEDRMDFIRQELGYTNVNYMQVSAAINDFLPLLCNSIEDIRVDLSMYEAREGTRNMFRSQAIRAFRGGWVDLDGNALTWAEAPMNSQLIIGLFCIGEDHDYKGWFCEKAEELLADSELNRIVRKAKRSKTATQTYVIALELLKRLWELGYCDPPQEEEEPDEQEAPPSLGGGEPDCDESDGSEGNRPEDASGGSDSPGDSDDDESDNQSGDGSSGVQSDGDSGEDSDDGDSESDSGDDGDEADDSTDGGSSDSSDDSQSSDGESGESESSETEESGDQSDGDGSDDTGDEGEVHGPDVAESSDAGNSDSNESDGNENEASGDGGGMAEECTGPSSGTESGEESSSGSDPGDGEPAPAGESSDEQGDSRPDGTESSEQGDNSTPEDRLLPRDSRDIDTGGEGGNEGGTKAPEPGDAKTVERIIAVVTGHPHIDEVEVKSNEAKENDRAVDVAVIQGQYFETPSAGVTDVRIHEFDKHVYEDGKDISDAWLSTIEDESDYHAPEPIMGRALMEMRRAFAENQATRREGSLKTGRLNRRALGSKAWRGDPHMFQQKTYPGARSYKVLIGLDISGSTRGTNIYLIKRAAFAQAELCHRMGIDFEVWAHTANSKSGSWHELAMDMYLIKAHHEQWSARVKNRLVQLNSDSQNVDGHTIEFYRKRIESQPATDRIIMYYTDGKFPAANAVEEEAVIHQELRTIKRTGTILTCVGIRTNSPLRLGLDTVRVDTDDDLPKVVKHLQKRLMVTKPIAS